MFIEEEDEEEDMNMNEWEALRTIEEFDYVPTGAGEEASTREMGDGSVMEMLPLKPLTPVSLLVESLLQQLCNLLEADSVRSQILYKSICEQLQQMNMIDDSWEMGEFEAMRSQYQRALFQLVTVARGQDLPHSLQTVWPLASPQQLDWSRYHRDFEELSFIAGGGFGKVYRARNRVDGTEYAIKKILIRSTSVDKVMSHLKEVRTFAGLNHINIVPYKAAWMEPLMSCDEVVANVNETQSWASSVDETTTNDSVIFAASNNNPGVPVEWTSSHVGQSASIEEHPHVKLRWAMLYIQMSLCHLTLREWLDRRNSSEDFSTFYAQFLSEHQSHLPCLTAGQNTNVPTSPEHCMQVSLEIFNQLACGLRYIHECRIVHHDIKPSNVFVSASNCGSLVVQLGDFGLACPLESSHRSGEMGTPLYAAPEQMGGCCDPKSDIYSLGIILLELLCPFSTGMERAIAVDGIKRGHPPADIPAEFAQLIQRLLGKPTKRPSASELCVISGEMLLNRASAITELERRLSEKDEEILVLKSQVEESERFKDMQIKCKNIEIQQLHMRYEEEKKTRDEEIRVLRERLSTVTVKELNDDD
uniref:non-specific serine/threonine protein kinase n=2 Tax=Nyssomyia neivai TaxID=330878 RepID=A0A1L8DRX6_9DIPT